MYIPTTLCDVSSIKSETASWGGDVNMYIPQCEFSKIRNSFVGWVYIIREKLNVLWGGYIVKDKFNVVCCKM